KKGTPIATVLSNRGCRAACTFCNVRTFNGVGVRHRSVESVLDELSILKNEYGVGHFIWLDDDLLHDEKRAIQLFEGMVKRNLNMTWDATNGLIAHSLCKEEVVAAAAASGCIGLYLGVESGNPQILKEIKKPGTVQTFVKAADIIRKYEQINARLLLIVGFPGETLNMILDTIKLAEKMDLDWCNIAILQPWKSTPIYDAMVEKGLLGEEEGTLKTKGNKIAPYNLGPYSRQRAIERGRLAASEGLQSIFEDLDLDSVPTPDQLDNIWFYMNYRVNFLKLFRETRRIKLEQQYKWLSYVHKLTAPDNALVMYFYGYLQHQVLGEVDGSLVLKLEEKLNQSEYWQERFEFLGLCPSHLREGRFSNHSHGLDEGHVLAFAQ
ncbi:MAG: radical SAM protein, partial [Nitrospinae bacterium]|nr:radical SAM protein [Nitrospinota bacterium]